MIEKHRDQVYNKLYFVIINIWCVIAAHKQYETKELNNNIQTDMPKRLVYMPTCVNKYVFIHVHKYVL